MFYDMISILKYNLHTGEKGVNPTFLDEYDLSLSHFIQDITGDIMKYIMSSNRYIIGEVITEDIHGIKDWMFCDIMIMTLSKTVFPYEKLKLNIHSSYIIGVIMERLMKRNIVVFRYGDSSFCMIGTEHGVILFQYIESSYTLFAYHISFETMKEILEDLVECKLNKVFNYSTSKQIISEVSFYHRMEFSEFKL